MKNVKKKNDAKIHGPNLIKLSMSLEINGWLLLPSIQNKRCKLYHEVEVNELWLVSPFSEVGNVLKTLLIYMITSFMLN